MTTLFLACAALGACVLLLQLLVGLFGLDPDADAPGGGSLGEGLDLLSVRSLSAGVAAFGLGGLFGLSLEVPATLAVALALAAGLLALVGTSWLMRQLLRLQSDGSLRIGGAVGAPATVYLPIPGEQRGPGKVHLALQGRTVELQAVTLGPGPIPTGAPVVVVSIVDPDTVEVVPTPSLEEVLDGNS